MYGQVKITTFRQSDEYDNLRALVDHGGRHPTTSVSVKRKAHVGREINFSVNRLLHVDVVDVGGKQRHITIKMARTNRRTLVKNHLQNSPHVS